MRRKIGRILAPVMAAMLVFGGCGNKTADRVTENQTHKTENESNEPVEKEPAEDEDELKEENQEEQNTQDQETDVEEEEERQRFRKRAPWILIIHRWMVCAWKKAAGSLW